MEGVGGRFAKWLTIDKWEMALWGWEIICLHNALFILYFYHLFLQFLFGVIFWLKRNTILNTYMQFLVWVYEHWLWNWRLRSCLVHQIIQSWHCVWSCQLRWSIKGKVNNVYIQYLLFQVSHFVSFPPMQAKEAIWKNRQNIIIKTT